MSGKNKDAPGFNQLLPHLTTDAAGKSEYGGGRSNVVTGEKMNKIIRVKIIEVG